MRLIRMLVLQENVDEVVDILEDQNIDYVTLREESGRSDTVLVEFPLPTQAVESVLDELPDSTEGEQLYTVVSSAESVFSDHIDEMEEQFITGTEEDDSISTEEVRTTALDMTPSPQTYYSMTLLSAFVATAGLLLDSPAIVVGSMVIAPLVGSALTASVGTVLQDRTMMIEGFKTQLFGLGLAIFASIAFSFGLKSAAFLPPALDVTTTQQISQRISPGLLSIVVGICAGGAGAFGLATGVSVMLVGVMIAAALIPAAAAVGIGVAWGLPAVAVGALLLLVLNAIAIHFSGVAVLWYLGYRPTDESDANITNHIFSRRTLGSVAVVVLSLGVVLGAGSIMFSHIAFEQEINQASTDVVSNAPYEKLELVTVRTEFRVPGGDSEAQRQKITVVVSRPEGRRYPDLSRQISERITAKTGRKVTVVSEFIDQQTYSPADQSK